MPATDLPLLIDAALAAGQIALRHWRADPARRDKPDGSPVSDADDEVDGHLRRALTRARPAYGWLSEETADDPARLSAEHCFVVDPIDGTRAFLEGRRTWAVSIAVAAAGRPTAGVVYLPAHDRLFAAAAGQGATLNGGALAVSGAASVSGATVLATRANLAPEHWQGGTPDVSRQFRPSMAYRLALVAEGRFDAMLTLKDAWEWDIAAGALIAAEAGAAVTDRHGAPLRFNTPGRQTPGILAAGPPLHAALLDRLG
ncbi:3'(2'),5'-bisphosphate nucleotidase CysQ [Rhodobacteraceae bacterium CCMM004]|nr:3'(2'),5'-bisphosphate nucleotidase CysQ [Rhodobacteraceae bacterium CCMM004]